MGDEAVDGQVRQLEPLSNSRHSISPRSSYGTRGAVSAPECPREGARIGAVGHRSDLDHLRHGKMQDMRLRVCATALLCVLFTFALQGCLLTRIFDTRTQLCDEQPPRVIVARQPGSGLRILFEKPTLTDRDVVLIVGYEPTEVTGPGAVREFSYEALPVNRPLDRTNGLVVRLFFTLLEGEYRLSEVEIPEKFNAILPPPLLDEAVRVVCKSQIGIVPPIATFDLASLDKATLPTRDAQTQLLGSPTNAIAGSDEISYRYCLAPCDSRSLMVANLRFSFGNHGELHRADASYFRYSAVVDLISSRPTATIELH